MVDQLPNRGREAEMLDEMGLSSMEDLFADIPSDVRFKGELPLPAPQSEEEIIRDARRLLGANADMGSRPSFLGAGLYRNYVPAAVFQLVTPGEIHTAYTPYQPQVSQGSPRLGISNFFELSASSSPTRLHDGSTAVAEALTCAVAPTIEKPANPTPSTFQRSRRPTNCRPARHASGAEIEIRTIAHNDDETINMTRLWKPLARAVFT